MLVYSCKKQLILPSSAFCSSFYVMNKGTPSLSSLLDYWRISSRLNQNTPAEQRMCKNTSLQKAHYGLDVKWSRGFDIPTLPRLMLKLGHFILQNGQRFLHIWCAEQKASHVDRTRLVRGQGGTPARPTQTDVHGENFISRKKVYINYNNRVVLFQPQK